MKAAYFMKHGGPEVLEYGDVPAPVASAGELVVDVHAASVNGADWKVRAGTYAPIARFPYVPGRDFSGTVAQTLPNTANVQYGNVTVSNTAGTTLGVALTSTNILGNLTVASSGI